LVNNHSNGFLFSSIRLKIAKLTYLKIVFRSFLLLSHRPVYTLEITMEEAGSLSVLLFPANEGGGGLKLSYLSSKFTNPWQLTSHLPLTLRSRQFSANQGYFISLCQWYSSYFVHIPPDVISLQTCTPKTCWCIIQVIHSL
jgi:hypothetical protein